MLTTTIKASETTTTTIGKYPLGSRLNRTLLLKGFDDGGGGAQTRPIMSSSTMSSSSFSFFKSSSTSSSKKPLEGLAQTAAFIFLCLLWYSSSALTNNLGKQILNTYSHPLSLTWIQFGFAALFSFLFANLSSSSSSFKDKSRRAQGLVALLLTSLFGSASPIKKVTWPIVKLTYPLALFQIFGHVFSSIAITYVAVSFLHTIKVRRKERLPRKMLLILMITCFPPRL